MKLLRLELLAFGPFTNVELDFASPGIHIVLGKNEAGKSTALRAITGLLYGIAKNTGDAHLHKMPDLRVGGSLRGKGGELLHVVRRKGRDNTLLDREGHPLADAILTKAIGGVSEEQFLTMFGIDHETLRRGGEALLLGQGNVGESLFGAAMAGGEVHQVLRGLRAEADALFTAKAHTKPLNEALKTWSEAHKRTREESTSHESIDLQTQGLEELRRDRAQCEVERQRLHRERIKLERIARALPILIKRQALTAQRAAMGEVVLLPVSFADTRTTDARTVGDAELDIARLKRQIADLVRRQSELAIPEALVAHQELPLDLANRLGSFKKAREELPRLHGEIGELEAEARTLLRKMGRDVPLDRAETWRIDAGAQATIRKLSLETTSRREARQLTSRALSERRARHAMVLSLRDRIEEAPDVSALKKAVARAEREGHLEAQLSAATAEIARIEPTAKALLSSLGLHQMTLDDASGLRIPENQTVERFVRQGAALERDEERLGRHWLELEERTTALGRELEALQLAGHVPTEQDLEQARQQRNQLFQVARTKKASAEQAWERYGAALRGADEIADRLRREAERVTRLASLLADRDALRAQRALLTERQKDLVERGHADRASWRTAWVMTPVFPGPPGEMKEWLERHAALVQMTDQLRARQAEVDSLKSAIRAHIEPLLLLLAPHHAPLPPSLGMASLVDLAGQLVLRAETAADERRQHNRDLAEIEVQLASLAADERRQQNDELELRAAWQAAVAPLGLTATASPEEATAIIDVLTETFHKIEEGERAKRRAVTLEGETQTFAADVEKLAREHAPDLLTKAPAEAAEQIVERYHRGKTALAERREITRQLAETEGLLTGQLERQNAAEGRLSAAMQNAGVMTMEALDRALRLSKEASKLDQTLAELDLELATLGGDAAKLQADTDDLDQDAVSMRLEELEADLGQLRERASMLDVRIGGHEAGLQDLRDPKSKAADAAADAEAALALVRELTERYLKARVAAIVLAREIERYRKENQGPVLVRAGELFRRLTLGSFAELRADVDESDQPVLRGVRSDGRPLGVEAMSDGTRDQLYLALRLATLERYAEANDPMPLVVDDILIHFDDDRARAALEILGELSERAQVLFFTHHARLVELARHAIPKGKLFVRELGEPTPPSYQPRL